MKPFPAFLALGEEVRQTPRHTPILVFCRITVPTAEPYLIWIHYLAETEDQVSLMISPSMAYPTPVPTITRAIELAAT